MERHSATPHLLGKKLSIGSTGAIDSAICMLASIMCGFHKSGKAQQCADCDSLRVKNRQASHGLKDP